MFFAGLPMFIVGLVRWKRCRRGQACAPGGAMTGELFRTDSFRVGFTAPIAPALSEGSLALAW